LPRYGRAQRCRKCGRVIRKPNRTPKCKPVRPVFSWLGGRSSGHFLPGACYFRGQGRRFRLPLRRRHYTIETWIKPARRSHANGGFVGWGMYGRANQVNAFRQWNGRGIINYWWANDIRKYGLPVRDGRWHHVAATFDGRYRRLYFDFKLVSSRYNWRINVKTKRNFCVGKTYGNERYRGWMKYIKIFSVARSGSLMRSGRSTPVVWMRGYRWFRRQRCLMRGQGQRANLPMAMAPYTLEARILPSRRSHFHAGLIGWGTKRRSSQNVYRLFGRDGLCNNYWHDDLWIQRRNLFRRGRRLHDGRWHHVAATFDGWTQRLYVDFRIVRSRRSKGPRALRYKKNFCIGQAWGGGGYSFRGRMGNVKVYRWARGVQEMRKNGC